MQFSVWEYHLYPTSVTIRQITHPQSQLRNSLAPFCNTPYAPCIHRHSIDSPAPAHVSVYCFLVRI